MGAATSIDGTGVVQVVTAIDGEDVAHELAGAAVEERLAACAQVSGPIASCYRWRGAVERASEWVVTFRTSRRTSPSLIARIRELHGYEMPEIVVTDVVDGDADYLAWVLDETS